MTMTLAAVGLFVPAAVAQTPADTVPVSLTFGWRPGMEAEVDVARKRTRGGTNDTVKSALSYRLRTSAHPEGLAITFDNFRIAAIQEESEMAEFEARLGALLPGFIVSRSGEFVRLLDYQRMRAQLDTIFGDMMSEIGEQPQLRQVMESSLSERSLSAQAMQEWAALVAAWAGAEMVEGETLENEVNEPVPMMPDVTLPFVYEYVLSRRVACTAVMGAPECVRLEMNSYPDPEAVESFLDRMMNMVSPDEEKPVFRGLDIRGHIVVVTTADRLLPYRLTIDKDVGMVMTMGGRARHVTTSDEKTYRFTWTGK
jgi:hypothetical protein